MKILCVADSKEESLVAPSFSSTLSVDLIVSCGDLDLSYLDELYHTYSKPIFFVFGNHQLKYLNDFSNSNHSHQFLHKYSHLRSLESRIIKHKHLLIFGIGGCKRYNRGKHQYSEREMKWLLIKKIPHLLYNKLRYGRFLDIFVTHAPPYGVHDDPNDPCHQGFKIFHWFYRTFKPRFHFHGHTHIYDLSMPRETTLYQTKIINTYSYVVVTDNHS